MLKKINALFVMLLGSAFAIEPASPAFFATDSFQRAHIGIHFVELKTGRDAVDYSKEHYFTPASLEKMITTAAALSFLGKEYRFKTSLEYEGSIDRKGVLHGNLWLVGGGDPTLTADAFSTWESALKEAGIQEVQGKIYADVSEFETALASPYWEFGDIGNYYAVGASGLTIHDSLYYLTFQPGSQVGDPATVISRSPEIPFLDYENEVTTGPAGSGDQVVVYGTEYSSKQYYRGTVPVDQPTFTVKAAISDPPLFCTLEFAKKIGLATKCEVIYEKPEIKQRVKLATTESIPLQELIKTMNFKSVNLYSEHLLKAIGKGSASSGLNKVREFLKWQSIPAKVYDGAGVARQNMITPKGLTTLLANIYTSSDKEVFQNSLPLYPFEGTLKNDQLMPLARATVHAKDGSMSGIYNLAGFITFPSGKEYAFAIFCNHYDGPLQEIRLEVNRFLLAIESALEHENNQKG